jgi:hypothetical protein
VVPIAALLVLFFGVAVLAGVGGRNDHRQTSALLRRRGAQRPVIVTFRLLEALLPVVGGLIVGVGIGLGSGGGGGAPWGGGGRGAGGGGGPPAIVPVSAVGASCVDRWTARSRSESSKSARCCGC